MRTERSTLSVEAATAAVLVAFCLGILTAGYSWDASGVHRTTVITQDGGSPAPAGVRDSAEVPSSGTIPPATYEKP